VVQTGCYSWRSKQISATVQGCFQCQRGILLACFVTHVFGHHDDVLMMVYSGSSLELSPEKSYLHLFPEITFLRTVRRPLVYLPARMHDSRRLP
jgi:hypothetical protein